MDILLADPVVFTVLAGLVGLAIGSFLNVVIHRLPRMMEAEWQQQCAEFKPSCPHCDHPLNKQEPAGRYNLLVPRSACPQCGHSITVLENIPLISWIALHGRCSSCKAPISYRYPLIEALTGTLSAAMAWHFGWGWAACGAILFLWSLIALTFIDFDTQLLPDEITLPLLWLGLLFNYFAVYTTLHHAVLGAIAGYLSLWSVYWLFKLATGKEGMGYGDFKLLAAVGAWLGWKIIPITILLSSVVGAVIGGVFLFFTRRGKDTQIPFGPYLAGAALIALIWGNDMTNKYLDFMN